MRLIIAVGAVILSGLLGEFIDMKMGVTDPAVFWQIGLLGGAVAGIAVATL